MSTPPQQGLKVSSCVAICGILSVLGLGLFGFSSSAYASSSVSVSNTGKISFNKVQPSSSGSITTGQDTLSISTDCPAGVNVYVSGLSGKSTELINNTASSNNTIATVNSISTPTTLSNNTWGLTTSSTDASNNRYLGLPTFSDAMNHLFYAGNDATLPIYYGAKVTNTLATGTYTGEVLYTVTINNSCLDYTINFNQNNSDSGSSGTMDTQAILPTGGTLAQNSFTRPGYSFLGWSLSATGKTGNAVDGIGTAEDVDFADKASFPGNNESILPGSENTLYAIWIKLTMQDWATENEIGNCGKLKIGDIVTLLDSRDNTNYKVKKLPDGRCWMIENLTLGSKGGVELTSEDTNMPTGSTSYGTGPDYSGKYYLPPAGYQGAINNSSTKTSTTAAVFSDSNDNQARLVYKASGTTDNTTGEPVSENTVYYNYLAASLGFSYYGGGPYSGNTPRDICPKGWRLPISGDKDEFGVLYGALGSWDALTSDYNTGNNANFSFTGFITTGSTPDYVGSSGSQWSSSNYNNATDAYVLSRHVNGNVNTKNPHKKYYGNPVRCVAIISATDYMQNFDSSTLPQNESLILMDSRDNHEYMVKKLPDGKVWMTQNLTLGSSGATAEQRTLTAEKTNIDDDTIFYLPPAGKQGYLTSTEDAYFTADRSGDRQSKTRYRSKSSDIVNDSDTMYYNYYTATLGHSSYDYSKQNNPSSSNDICPKGWRLPYAADISGIVTGSKNDFAYLASQYGPLSGSADSYEYYSDNSNVLNGMYLTAASPIDSNAGFSYSGYANNSGISYSGTYGMYWTSSTSSASERVSYSLFFASSRVYPQYYNYSGSGWSSSMKYFGAAVRCIANTGSYTINYDPNGGTGEMPQSVSKDILLGGKVILRKNQFTNNNLSFVGWSTDPSATTATYPDETTVYNLGSDGDTVTLYAVWSEPEQMQNWNGCSSLPEGQITSLQDSRDNTVYTVKKFSDGSCWMIDNLILGHDKGYALTNELTNIQDSDTETYYLPPAGYQGALNSAGTMTSTVDAKFCYSSNCGGDAIAKLHYVPSYNTSYYNFYTATLGKSYYNLNGTISGYLEKDICPKGWQIPTGYTSGSKSWSYFYGTLNNSAPSSMFSNSFRRTGYYFSQESYSSSTGTQFYTSLYTTTEGYWWSSTVRNQRTTDKTLSFNLTLDQNDSFNAQAVTDRYKGLPVRCVIK